MFRGGTVKQFKDMLQEMKTVYKYDDEKTRMAIGEDVRSFTPCSLCIVTTDEATGVEITMQKVVEMKGD